MKVELLTPDVAPAGASRVPSEDQRAFSEILDDVGAALRGADRAENAYANGAGKLADAVYERARADVVLSVATAAAQRSAQALTTILNLQV